MDEKYVTVNGYKTRYLEEGNSDKNLILLHGLGGSAEKWALVIPSLNLNSTSPH
ncbi:MAG: alpha/beta fold hydrolase [Nitrosotalea sp.]